MSQAIVKKTSDYFKSKGVVLPSISELQDPQIINDPNLGRKNKEDITICDLTGTGVQDTAIARFTFNLCKKNNLGINI